MSNPQSWNGYAYVNNSPLNATDPSGLFSFSGIFQEIGNFFGDVGSAVSNWFNPPCGSDFCVTGTSKSDINSASVGLGGGLVAGGASGLASGGDGSATFTATGLGKADIPNASTSSQQPLQPPNSGMPPPPPVPPKSCEEQLSDIYEAINGVRAPGTSGFKGLAQRYNQIGRMSMGARPGHIDQFLNRQGQLQRMINNYRNSGCGDPPSDVMDWATRPAPDGTVRPWANYVIIGGVVVVGTTAILAPEALPVLMPVLVP